MKFYNRHQNLTLSQRNSASNFFVLKHPSILSEFEPHEPWSRGEHIIPLLVCIWNHKREEYYSHLIFDSIVLWAWSMSVSEETSVQAP